MRKPPTDLLTMMHTNPPHSFGAVIGAQPAMR
jgi:hypothetical protein